MLRQYYSLECDMCGKTLIDAWITQKLMLGKAKKQGWQVSRERHLCPKCKRE